MARSYLPLLLGMVFTFGAPELPARLGSEIGADGPGSQRAPIAADSVVRDHRWRADLHAFAMHLETEHPAPFVRLPREDFEKRLLELDRAIPALRDAEIAARWAALLAALGEEHTEVDFEGEFGARRLPVDIGMYGDGAFVVAATATYRQLLGARLDQVEGVPVDRIYTALKPYVPFSQEGWYRHTFEDTFKDWAGLIEGAHLVDTRERWTLRGTLPGGGGFSVEVSLFPRSEEPRWELEPVRGGTPLRNHYPDRPYFFRVIPKEKAVYLRLRRCQEDPSMPFRSLLTKGLKMARRKGVVRVVVDLRGNMGGRDSMAETMVAALRRDARPGRRGPLLVLTDGSTFSAGAVMAWRLRHDAGALIVGEACGASANHVGAVEDFRLPSGRKSSFGSEIHIIDKAHPEDFSSPILPDRKVGLNHADKIHGRDPILEEALRWPERPPEKSRPSAGECRP